jgi:HAD superfamily hydrolase (TIGR01484 family)
MVKLLVINLYGTLLNENKEMDSYTLSILKRCKEKNIIICIATGGPESTNKEYIKKIKPKYILYHNGGLVKCGNDIIYKKLMDENTYKGIMKDYKSAEWVSEILVELENDCPHDQFYKHAFSITLQINTDELLKKLQIKYIDCKFLKRGVGNWYDIFENKLNKIEGIYKIIEKENIKYSEIVCFGNNENDLDMFLYSGIGIAMENSDDKLKSIAKYICKNNKDIGIWIENNILNKIL